MSRLYKFWLICGGHHIVNIKNILEKLGPYRLGLVCPPYDVIWTTLGYAESGSKVLIARFDMWNARDNLKTQSKHSL